MKWDNICEHPQVANFFERMTQLPLEAITPMVPPGGAGIGMHVIPVEKAISMEISLLMWNIFLIGLINMTANMRQARVRAVIAVQCAAKAVPMTLRIGVSVSAIWRITLLKQIRATISHVKRLWKFFSVPRITVLFTKLLISTVKIKFCYL